MRQAREEQDTMEKVVVLKHEPYWRYSIIRRHADGECAWCGRAARWQYGLLKDGCLTPPQWEREAFCSRSCERAYND